MQIDLRNEDLIIYTDGSSRGNPGPGGYGVLALGKEKVNEWGGRNRETTNNRMEMTGVIEALVYTINKNKNATIKTDSEYTIKGTTSWMKGWKNNGWKTSAKKPVLNQDLWMRIDDLITEAKKRDLKIKFEHVKGHTGEIYNERVDRIATAYADEEYIELFDGNTDEYRL